MNDMKKNILKNMLYACISAICIAGLGACSDEEEYDFPGDPYNRVYLVDNSTTYKVVQTPIGSVSNVDFRTILKCTRPASGNIKATVEVDNSLIAAYNEEKGTSYEGVPESAVSIKNATLTIPAGSMIAADTLELSLTEDETILKSLTSENGYLIPLRIVTADGGDAQPSTNINSAYLIVTVTEDNVNHDATESDIKGTLVADQTGWTATTGEGIDNYGQSLETLFDNDGSSYAYLYGSNPNLDIDLGKEYTFDAITLYYSGYWGDGQGGFSNGTKVYTSSDGTTWKPSGEMTGTSKFCVFYAPITTRYVRIVYSNSYWQIGVFNIYATK